LPVVNRISRTAEVEGVLLSKLHELAGPDGRLPSEAEIARMFDVSRTTVRAAVGALVARGLIVRRQGMGSFASQASRITNPLDEAIDFSEIIERNRCCPSVKFLSTQLISLDDSLAERLNQSDHVGLQRHTVFFADSEPVIYCVNTIPFWVLRDDLAQEVTANPAISEPIYEFLARNCNQRVELSRATIWPDSARNCGIPEDLIDPAMPMLVIEEIGYSLAGQPVLHSLEYYPGRSMRFELVRRRTSKP
jgi:GntR family transcriptional regulator